MNVHWEMAGVGQLHRLEQHWREVHARGWPTPVLSFDFVAAAVHAFARGDELIVLGRTGERVVALGILQRCLVAGWSTFQPSQAPLGIWLHDPACDLAEMLRTLLPRLPGVALLVGVTQQDPLRTPRPRRSSRLSTFDYISIGSVSVDRSFQVYWEQRDKELRRKLKRRLARLAEQGLAPRLEVVRDPSAVAAQIAAFGELESAGWKSGLGTAVHAGNAQGAFYRDLLTRFCRRKAGRIYRYVAAGRVLAMTLCIEHEGTLASLKTTYDESLRACAPGVLMKADMFRELFEGGAVRRIEFYGSVQEWQLKWIDAVRTLYHVNAYRLPLLRAAHEMAGRLRRAQRPAALPVQQA